MIEFFVWHGLAMTSVIAISFTAGYLTGKKRSKHYRNVNGL